MDAAKKKKKTSKQKTKKTNKTKQVCLLQMPEMISLAFESDWHLSSHRAPPAQNSSNFRGPFVIVEKAAFDSSSRSGPEHIGKKNNNNSNNNNNKKNIPADFLTARVRLTRIRSVGWLPSERIDANVSVVSLYTSPGPTNTPWRERARSRRTPPVLTVSLLHITDEWLDLE